MELPQALHMYHVYLPKHARGMPHAFEPLPHWDGFLGRAVVFRSGVRHEATAGCHHAKNMVILSSVFFICNNCTFTYAWPKIFYHMLKAVSTHQVRCNLVCHMCDHWKPSFEAMGNIKQSSRQAAVAKHSLVSSFRQVILGATTLQTKKPCNSLLFAT